MSTYFQEISAFAEMKNLISLGEIKIFYVGVEVFVPSTT